MVSCWYQEVGRAVSAPEWRRMRSRGRKQRERRNSRSKAPVIVKYPTSSASSKGNFSLHVLICLKSIALSVIDLCYLLLCQFLVSSGLF